MNYILIGIIVALGLAVAIMAIKWPKIIELTDIAPEEDTPKNRWLKLQNEGGKYVRNENGTIKLKIVK